MDAQRYWSEFFARWPASIARKGVLVTNFGEQVPFSGFLTAPDLLIAERQTPDTMGTRKVILPYGAVSAVKIVDVVKDSSFTSLGFRGSHPATATTTTTTTAAASNP